MFQLPNIDRSFQKEKKRFNFFCGLSSERSENWVTHNSQVVVFFVFQFCYKIYCIHCLDGLTAALFQ